MATVNDLSAIYTWGVLLDVDGVILDSYAAFQTVWGEWSAMHSLEFETVWAATHGRRPVETIEAVAPHLDGDTEYAWLQKRANHPDLAFPPIDGAKEFLNSLPPQSWALVTSSFAPAVRRRFQRAKLPEPIKIVDAVSVRKGKPSPDCYELGASLLGVAPERCLVVEDAPAGIEAGIAAGCYVVGLTTTHTATQLENAHVIVDSLNDVRDILDRTKFRELEP